MCWWAHEWKDAGSCDPSAAGFVQGRAYGGSVGGVANIRVVHVTALSFTKKGVLALTRVDMGLRGVPTDGRD